MNNFEYSVICIDFRDFSSSEELDNFFEDTGLDLNGSDWYSAHTGKWINGVVVNKVWLDVNTLNLIAYETQNQQMIYPQFAQYLSELKPIDRSFRYENVEFDEPKDLSLDDILDKILEHGSESLTDFERNFLNEQSELQ
jgi:hypothetical protein